MKTACCNCEIWFGDDTSDDPVFHGTTFTLQLRMPTDESVKEENDGFSHSTTDGELICEWEIPTYGNTVYESVKKFFEDRTDKIYFRAEQHTLPQTEYTRNAPTARAFSARTALRGRTTI